MSHYHPTPYPYLLPSLLTISPSQFLLRQQSISLYRDLLRVSRQLQDPQQKTEMRKWIRGEFDKWKHTKDEVRKEFSVIITGSRGGILDM